MKIYKKHIGKLSILALLFLVSFSCQEKECEYEQKDLPPYSCEAGMDVAFLIDYTGSMGGVINDIKSSIGTILPTIIAESGGDYRLSLSIFDEVGKDHVGNPQPAGYSTHTDYTSLPATQRKIITTGTSAQYLTMMEPFAAGNNTSFTTQLNKLNGPMPLGGGNGFPEPGGLLLNEILNNTFAGAFRTTSITKLAIIITDAPAGGDDDTADATDDTFLTGLAATANSMGVQCVLITSMVAGTSNYEISLIDNNTDSMKITGSDFSNISTDIITMIENVCENNAEDSAEPAK